MLQAADLVCAEGKVNARAVRLHDDFTVAVEVSTGVGMQLCVPRARAAGIAGAIDVSGYSGTNIGRAPR